MAIGDPMGTWGGHREVSGGFWSSVGEAFEQVGEAALGIVTDTAAATAAKLRETVPIWVSSELDLGSQDQLRDPLKTVSNQPHRQTPILTTAGTVGGQPQVFGLGVTELAIVAAVVVVGIVLVARG